MSTLATETADPRPGVDSAGTTPLVLALCYMGGTYLYYLVGPLDWPNLAKYQVAAVLVASWLALAVGYQLAIRTQLSGRSFTVDDVSRLVVVGATLNLATFPIALYGYTGSAIGDISFSLASQGDVYTNRYQFLINGSAGAVRTAAAFSRALVAPMVFGGIIIGARRFKNLKTTAKLALLLSLFLQIAFSFARGTDKEVVDIFLFLSVAVFVNRRGDTAMLLKRTIAVGIVALIVLTIFIGRREARRGELSNCFDRVNVCSDAEDSLLIPFVGESGHLAATEIAIYVTQGYHGFSLAQDIDFESTYGLGHAPALTRAAELATGLPLNERTFNTKLGEKQWDQRFAWSTLYTSIGNDVSMPLIPLVFLPLGWIFARSWQYAIRDNDAAYMIFVFLVMLFFYSPANNQLGVGTETYSAFIYWIYRWFRS